MTSWLVKYCRNNINEAHIMEMEKYWLRKTLSRCKGTIVADFFFWCRVHTTYVGQSTRRKIFLLGVLIEFTMNSPWFWQVMFCWGCQTPVSWRRKYWRFWRRECLETVSSSHFIGLKSMDVGVVVDCFSQAQIGAKHEAREWKICHTWNIIFVHLVINFYHYP